MNRKSEILEEIEALNYEWEYKKVYGGLTDEYKLDSVTRKKKLWAEINTIDRI